MTSVIKRLIDPDIIHGSENKSGTSKSVFEDEWNRYHQLVKFVFKESKL